MNETTQMSTPQALDKERRQRKPASGGDPPAAKQTTGCPPPADSPPPLTPPATVVRTPPERPAGEGATEDDFVFDLFYRGLQALGTKGVSSKSALQYSPGRYRVTVLNQRFEMVRDSPRFILGLFVDQRYDCRWHVQVGPKVQLEYQKELFGQADVADLLADLRVMGITLRDITLLHPDAPNHVRLEGHVFEVVCDLSRPEKGECWSIASPLTLDGLREVLRFEDLEDEANAEDMRSAVRGQTG